MNTTAQTLQTAYTMAPLDMLMPAAPQLITTIIYGLGAVGFVLYAVLLAIRHKTLLPIYFVLGALLTIYLEPVVDLLGNALHPQLGQYNVLTTNGHPVPWAVLLGYVWYFAGAFLLLFQPLIKQQLQQKHIWIMVASVVTGAAVVEQIPVHFGVWVYYGEQWPKIGYMPVWWIFANTAAVAVPFVMVYRLLPKLQSWQQPLVILLIPTGAFMGHAGAGWPMYNLLGTQTEAIPSWLMLVGSASTVVLALMLVWVFMQLLEVPTQSTTEP